MAHVDARDADATRVQTRRVRHRVREQLRHLRHAALTGPDHPPPFRLLRRLRQHGLLLGVGVTVLLGLALLSALGVWLTRGPLLNPPGGLVSVGAAMVVVAILLLALHRPLLAWRITWLLAAYETVAAVWYVRHLYDMSPLSRDPWPGGGIMPRLDISPAMLVLLLTVTLFLLAVSQDRGVAFWAWLLTVGSVVVAWVAVAGPQIIPAPAGLPFPLAPGLGVPLIGRPGQPQNFGHPLLVLATVIVPVTVGLLAGLLVHRLSRARRQLVEVQERGLVLDERARIARELHDVVAHHVSMIAVRAETAPYRLEGLSDPAREEFTEISQISRESLTEMRRLLGVLRSDGPAPTTPQPGLADLAELVEWIRATGTPVRLETHGSMAGLPAAVDVSAYRILQEALTNAARHATGAPVHLRLDRTTSDLTLSVRNGPRPGRAGGSHGAPPAAGGTGGGPPSGPGGHGVRGMRERASMLGGELHAGPTGDGGFEVTAHLPLRAAAP